MSDHSNDPTLAQPCARALTLPELSGELTSLSTDFAEKPRQPNLPKARKLSRIFSGLSFLDPFTSRKSIEDLRASRRRPHITLVRPATSHGHTHKTSNFDTKQPRTTSSMSTLSSILPQVDALVMPTSTPKTLLERSPQSSIVLDTLSAPQIKPPISPSPESIPLPPCRPNSPPWPMITRKRSKALVPNRLEDDTSTIECQVPYSQSLSQTPGDSSLKVARQHFAEVKRARKMTQLFGQELPPELIQVADDRWKTERSRARADSTVSSIIDSVPSALMCESCASTPGGESVMLTSSPRADFQERRRRVAKLSQFFGVDHTEIASSIVFTKPDHHRTTSSDNSQKPVSFASKELSEVGIKVVSRRRWGLGEDMRDVELGDAINKLRCLKAN